MIIRVLAGDSFAANCYIVASETTRRGLVIDPGGKAQRILDALAELEVTVAAIVLTHAHIDHITGLDPLRKATGAPFAACIADEEPSAAPRELIPGLTFTPFRLPIPPDRTLRDGDTLAVDEISFTVLHTPGHSADSLCLLGQGLVFTGDTLLKGRVGASLPGLLPGYDHHRMLESIRCKLMILPDDTVVYPGHGAPTTIGEERRTNPMLLD